MKRLFLKARFRRFRHRTWKRIRSFAARVLSPLGGVRIWWFKRQLNRSLRVLDALDWQMDRAGWKRDKRRQFWRDFIKRRDMRVNELNRLTQQ